MKRPIERRLLPRTAVSAIAGPLLAAAAGLHGASAATLSDHDQSYLTTAIRAELGLYAEGRLAAEKGQDPGVKRLGAQIEQQALQANRTLARFARNAHVDVPTTPPLRESSHYDDLNAANGKAFDQTFLREVAIDLNIDVDNARDEQQHGDDPALKKLAADRARALDANLTVARKLAR
jgi:predicted outer membrane protein